VIPPWKPAPDGRQTRLDSKRLKAAGAGEASTTAAVQIIDPYFNKVEAGLRFDMSAEDVIAYCKEEKPHFLAPERSPSHRLQFPGCGSLLTRSAAKLTIESETYESH